jgi:ABC-type uncharacterized transport system substrate-binding protein
MFLVLLMFPFLPGEEGLSRALTALLQTLPHTTRIAVLHQASNPWIETQCGPASIDHQVKIFLYPVKSMKDLPTAMDAALDGQPNLILFLDTDSLGRVAAIRQAARLSSRRNTPLFCDHAQALDHGAHLLSWSPDRAQFLFQVNPLANPPLLPLQTSAVQPASAAATTN